MISPNFFIQQLCVVLHSACHFCRSVPSPADSLGNEILEILPAGAAEKLTAGFGPIAPKRQFIPVNWWKVE